MIHDIPIIFQNDRPFIEIKIHKVIKALIDTGAAFPVLNVSVEVADTLATKSSDKLYNLSGFGVNPQPCYLYRIEAFKLGKTVFLDFPCLVPKEVKLDISQMVLPASMFRGTVYCFDTVNNNLKIIYPDDYDINQRLCVTDCNGKLVVLPQSDVEFRNILGDTTFNVYTTASYPERFSLNNLTLQETLDKMSMCKEFVHNGKVIEVTKSSFSDLEKLKYF